MFFWCNNGRPLNRTEKVAVKLKVIFSKLKFKISLGECLVNIVSKSKDKIKVISFYHSTTLTFASEYSKEWF